MIETFVNEVGAFEIPGALVATNQMGSVANLAGGNRRFRPVFCDFSLGAPLRHH